MLARRTSITRHFALSASMRTASLPKFIARSPATFAVTRNAHTHTRIPKAVGLYDPAFEKDNCGVGLVAQLQGKASRRVVVDANTMLVRMSHRGGCGCEPNSGDGAGMLTAIPDKFMREVAAKEIGITLPVKGEYAVGNVFLDQDVGTMNKCKHVFERELDAQGLQVLGWRRVPTDNSSLGDMSRNTEPVVEQIFVANNTKLERAEFERRMLLARTVASKNIGLNPKLGTSFYVCSLSSFNMTYKGQLTPEQVSEYFLDLQDPSFESHMALVHSRFSTNTFPSWPRAQPNRMLCHNGEINTLRGNMNMMHARGSSIYSPYFKSDTQKLLPVCSGNMSDSGNFDAVLELITLGSKREIYEAMMMMIPEAWQQNPGMDPARKAMYEFNSCAMEPWDGPAMMAFSDGRYVGACLDRNGLRPSRYYVTKDDHLLLSSEVGVVPDLKEVDIAIKSRLEPGRILLVDFEEGRIVPDKELKERAAVKQPFKEWLGSSARSLSEWSAQVPQQPLGTISQFKDTNRRLNMFGYTAESLDVMMGPMAVSGIDALGSMGTDTPLAILSNQPRLPFAYFKQLFAQVTNPPIDPIREAIVMSLKCPVGPEANLLDASDHTARRLMVDSPVLSLQDMVAVKTTSMKQWRSKVLDTTFPVGAGSEGLEEALDKLCADASAAIEMDGSPVIVLSDKAAGKTRLPIPSLVALGAVHTHLLRTRQRTRAALFVESGDAREVHDFCLLLGYGADGVCPYVAYEALAKMNADGLIEAKAGKALSDSYLEKTYTKAVEKGIYKVMSKMGISTLHSYKGAQIFEAVGLNNDVINRCFQGTTSRIGGANFDIVYKDLELMHAKAFPEHTTAVPLVTNPGEFHFRNGGEEHMNTPNTITAAQLATKHNSRELYDKYAKFSNEQASKVTLRGLLKFRDDCKSIPLTEVEPATEIVKRFVTGAMSYGSISAEAHESLAIAMNRLGGRSNTGEGGEDPERFERLPNGDSKRSAIKQVASGRFGVTSNYLANSDQIQIKMAQGAKPGEGGELPGYKVSKEIGKTRHTTAGVGLISPPPHHDIYSIEDLAQLIHDLKNANPVGTVSVKLVSEVGVGTVAAGVAKAKADHIVVSGCDGGTGAATWTSVKYAGLPWELGVAEAQQTLMLNNLRSRVKLQTDGQLKTGRDVVIAALLGAEEFAFSTQPLIVLGCIMMRKCHLNTCPVGVATQDPVLRKKFRGQPEHVVNFFFLMAEEIRGHMAKLGFRRMDDMIGAAGNVLEADPTKLNYKSKGLDLSPILLPGKDLNPDSIPINVDKQDHGIEHAVDNLFIAQARKSIETGAPVKISHKIDNLNRTVGTMLSYHISKKYGEAGLPDDTIHIKLQGQPGQSFGFALAKGVTMEVEGDCNDYTGKALSGGRIIVYPSPALVATGFVPEHNVIVGNVSLYGATRGEAYFRGKAGERFCVRNSGATAVVEGLGDHGCEYMTGGTVVVLGPTGRNFAAGMSGGIAYVYDPAKELPSKCNMEMVELFSVEDAEEMEGLKQKLLKHQEYTGSGIAASLLGDWSSHVKHFVKVYPNDYRRVLEANIVAAKAAVA